MGIRKGLKIDDEFFRMVAPAKKFNPFPHLLRDRFQTAGVPWTKRIVVAVDASSHRYRAVPIRAAESGIDADFGYAASEVFL